MKGGDFYYLLQNVDRDLPVRSLFFADKLISIVPELRSLSRLCFVSNQSSRDRFQVYIPCRLVDMDRFEVFRFKMKLSTGYDLDFDAQRYFKYTMDRKFIYTPKEFMEKFGKVSPDSWS